MQSASPSPLAPLAILRGMADALPTHQKEDTTSDFSSSLEAISLFVHACMTTLGFRLLGFDQDRKTEAECARLAPHLPTRWNSGLNSHGFVYSHIQSSMQFVVKVDRLGGKTEIRGLAVGDERIVRTEISARDYISTAALPLRIARADNGSEDRSDLEDRLRKVFISDERIADLANLIKVDIIQRLIPSLQKEGYQESPDDRQAREDAARAACSRRPTDPNYTRPPRLPDPLRPGPPRPLPFTPPTDLFAPLPPAIARRSPPPPPADFPPPDFEDEYEVNRPPRADPLAAAGRSPYNIGHDDLNPPNLGPHDPLRGSFVGGGGGSGLPRPGGFGGGGMHPTFDDPLFQGPRGGGSGGGGGGSGGFDPQAPPGARWDPLGPGGAPRFGGGRPGRGGHFGGGGGPYGGFGGGDII